MILFALPLEVIVVKACAMLFIGCSVAKQIAISFGLVPYLIASFMVALLSYVLAWMAEYLDRWQTEMLASAWGRRAACGVNRPGAIAAIGKLS